MIVISEEAAVYFAAAIAWSAAWGWRVFLSKRLALSVDSVATSPAHAGVVAARPCFVAAKHGELDVETLLVANAAVAHEGLFPHAPHNPARSFYA